MCSRKAAPYCRFCGDYDCDCPTWCEMRKIRKASQAAHAAQAARAAHVAQATVSMGGVTPEDKPEVAMGGGPEVAMEDKPEDTQEVTPKKEMTKLFIYNEGEEIPGFKYDVKTNRWECTGDHSVFVSWSYSYWDRVSGDMPFDPWDQTRDDDEYNNEHTNEMVCFVYRIENSEFTTADVFASKKFDDEDSGGGKSFTVTVNVIINGEPANYTLTASLDSSAYDDCETVINFDFDHCEFNGFPPGISLNIKKVANRGYYDEDSTWALSATP
jgi:hypothetical protein